MLEIELPNLDATRMFANRLAACLNPPMLIALDGTLGAGKTQLVRYMAAALHASEDEVSSPTYVLWQRYRGKCVIHHLDFYRMNSASEVWDLGFDELLEQQAFIFVEWAEKFPECLPPDYLSVRLTLNDWAGPNFRRVTLISTGPQSQDVLAKLQPYH